MKDMDITFDVYHDHALALFFKVHIDISRQLIANSFIHK